jgi:hypothetical protein
VVERSRQLWAEPSREHNFSSASLPSVHRGLAQSKTIDRQSITPYKMHFGRFSPVFDFPECPTYHSQPVTTFTNRMKNGSKTASAQQIWKLVCEAAQSIKQ